MHTNHNMLSSATRVSLLLALLALIGLNYFAIIYYPDTIFAMVFDLFKTFMVAVTTYFFTKSKNDATKTQAEEKKEEPFIV